MWGTTNLYSQNLVENLCFSSSDSGSVKKNGKLRICVDFRKLNVATKKNPYPLQAFTNEVIHIIVGHEVHTLLVGFSRHHHIFILLKDQYKIVFVVDWGGFNGL
jgi:hypothetical protein